MNESNGRHVCDRRVGTSLRGISIMKFSTKFACLAAASVMAVGLPSAANAALVISFDGESGTFNSPNNAGGAFDQTGNFNIGAVPGFLSATISSSKTGPNTDIDFTSVTINGLEFDIVSDGVFEFRTFLDGSGIDPQVLRVMGNSSGNGSYSGTLSFAAVPEPATWAMMIFGFGLVGGAVRRRKANVSVSYA